jgi:excisionase family DNA binding protein
VARPQPLSTAPRGRRIRADALSSTFPGNIREATSVSERPDALSSARRDKSRATARPRAPGVISHAASEGFKIQVAHPSGFEPLTYGSGVSTTPLGESSKRSQAVVTARIGTKGRVQPSHGLAPFSSPFAAPVLQGSGALRARPAVVERWLTVKEVAERFGVCTATVYALCKRGALRHLRVGNSIRVAEPDLARLVAAGGD